MEEKEKVALNDELVDKVVGGLRKSEYYICPICGSPATYGYHQCPSNTIQYNQQEEQIARA